MKKTLKKSPVIAFAEVLCQRAVEICSAANNGEDPEIIIKAWDGSFEEEIKRVTGSLETVIVMERPEIVPDKLSRSGKSTARWHVTVESNPLLDGDGWDADDLASQAGIDPRFADALLQRGEAPIEAVFSAADALGIDIAALPLSSLGNTR